jgi:ACS family allantoate permease-like MFS transporter
MSDIEKNGMQTSADAERKLSVASVAQGKLMEHSHDADEAMAAFAEMHGMSLEIDEATNKRLLRRIDWNLLPVCPST